MHAAAQCDGLTRAGDACACKPGLEARPGGTCDFEASVGAKDVARGNGDVVGELYMQGSDVVFQHLTPSTAGVVRRASPSPPWPIVYRNPPVLNR